MRESASGGRADKSSATLNRSEAELGAANVLERSVYALYNWRGLLLVFRKRRDRQNGVYTMLAVVIYQ